MKQIELKNIKKGDTFYEQAGEVQYKFVALNDCVQIGEIQVMDQTFKQYKVDVENDQGQKTYITITDGFGPSGGSYFIE